MLERYRAAARGITPFDFYAGILSGGARRSLMARLGTEAMEPIDEFLNLALAFESSTAAPTLAGFLGWFDRAEPEIKRDMDASHGQVRVMTVHGAKGLEANIVILADTCDLPHQAQQSSILFAGAQEIPFWKLRKSFWVPVITALEEEARGRRNEEMKRLLYVALTRARHRLYIAGHCSKAEPDPKTWYCMIERALAGTFGAIAANCQDALGSPARRYQASGGSHPGDKPRLDRLAMQPVTPPGWAGSTPASTVSREFRVRPSRLAESLRLDDTGQAAASTWPRSGRRFARGVLIHRLLERLPPLEESRRADFAGRFLDRHGGDLTAAERHSLVADAMKVLGHPDLAPLFSADSLAEVPLQAEIIVAGRSVEISGQIDRLSVTPTAVLIADYKSDRNPPQAVAGVDAAYIRQLAAYRAALRQIYPDRLVRAALVWTDGPTIMEVPEALLDLALRQ
jgi:ATP-dependent helicase/nuclease subunit A